MDNPFEYCPRCRHFEEDQSEYHYCLICVMDHDCFQPADGEMPEMEKVINHLNDCLTASRQDNTWVFVRKDIINDAVALLKEQEIGHWVVLENCSNAGVYCSECNTKIFDHYPIKKKQSYFCPHCGTRMEGEIERL